MIQILLSNPIVGAYNSSDLFGKGIFITLFFLSIITWMLFLQKFFLQKKAIQQGKKFEQVFKKKRLSPLSLNEKALHPFAQLYQTLKVHTLEILGKNKLVKDKQSVTLSASDMDLIETHLMNTISICSKQMERYLFVLSTIVSLAPFLGLLGTVWGILLTFNELQSSTVVNTNATIMGGLGMALGTTIVGLVVAIPALIGYNYLRASVTNFSGEMEDFSHELLSSVALQYREVDVK